MKQAGSKVNSMFMLQSHHSGRVLLWAVHHPQGVCVCVCVAILWSLKFQYSFINIYIKN